MKIYQMSEKKKRTYKAVGIFYVLVFAAVLVVKPWHYANPLYDILIYVFVAGLAVCNLFRSRFCRCRMAPSAAVWHFIISTL